VRVWLVLLQRSGQPEERGGLEGLLAPVDPAGVHNVELVTQRQIF
jgi:hypothetical protein